MTHHFKPWNLVLLSLIGLLHAHFINAQILEGIEENFWKPAAVHFGLDASGIQPDKIGNHSCWLPNATELVTTLEAIAKEREGTLFIVAKLSIPYEGSLLELGGLTIESDEITCAGSRLESIHLGTAPFLLKVRYQTGQRRKWDDEHMALSEVLQVAEVVHYKQQLTADQSRRVESYLALKYSINITDNSNTQLRDYRSDDIEHHYWDNQSDGLYNGEVLGIGQVSAWNWQQLATSSSDSKTITIGLAGDAPQLSDGSVLVVSRKPQERTQDNCMLSSKDFPWKLNFYNWESNSEELLVSWETEDERPGSLLFTNGIRNISLLPQQVDNRLSVSIPINEVLNQEKDTWFLIWDNGELLCDAAGTITLSYCDNKKADTDNQFIVELEEEALPANYQLHNVQSGEMVNGQLNSINNQFSQLPAGQYRLSINQATGVKLEELLHFPACAEGDDKNLADINVKSLPDNYGLGEPLSNTITLYPNPLKDGNSFTADFHQDLNGQDFTIEVFDQTGRLISSSPYSPSDATSYQQSLDEEGTYYIHFKSSSTVVTMRIVVL